MKIFKQLIKNVSDLPKSLKIILGLTFLAAVILRFYNIYDFITFLGDQGRDAIILKRIVTLEHFPAIGASSSVGRVFLGPFYYYFIAPWMLVSGFDPVGPAIGVAVFSTIFLWVVYLVVKEIVDLRTAVVSLILMTFSGVMVSFSRYSWNPNLLPFSALLTAYFTYEAIKKQKLRDFFLVGIFFGISIQLHYVALALGLPVVIAIVNSWRARDFKKDIRKIFMECGMGLLGFIFISIPLIVFDLRHQFLNVKNFIALFSETDSVSSHGAWQIMETFHRLNELVLFQSISMQISILLFVIFCAAWIYAIQKKKNISFFITFFMFTLLITSFYTGVKHVHYFVALYPFYFIVLGWFISLLFQKKWLIPVGCLLIIVFICLQTKDYYFLYKKGSNQIGRSQRVAKVIFDNIKKDKIQVTGLPDDYSDSTYRYFIELWGKRSLEKDSIERADELFVICEKECSPIGDSQWDIAFFAPTKIVGTWHEGDVTIIKLVR